VAESRDRLFPETRATPGQNAKKQAFFSYSHSDKAFVSFVFGDLRALDLDIWIDELEMGPGDSLVDKIGAGISESDFVVAFLSEASIQSNWVRTELAIAATKGIRDNSVVVLPVLLNSIQPSEIPPYLSHLIYMDLRAGRKYDESLAALVGRLSPKSVQLGASEIQTPLWRKVLMMDDARSQRLVSAGIGDLRDWALDYLVNALGRPDGTERHWAYTALGKLGGAVGRRAVEQGLNDKDNFARLGAERAWKKIADGAAGI
jgi:TIR domain-containing protein